MSSILEQRTTTLSLAFGDNGGHVIYGAEDGMMGEPYLEVFGPEQMQELCFSVLEALGISGRTKRAGGFTVKWHDKGWDCDDALA